MLHTADTHLGYRQYHSPERRADYLRAFEATVDDAIEQRVDAVVHAGDLFHDRRPGLPDLQGTIAALRRLADEEIPFLAVVGNHETKRDGQWLDLFEELGLATRLGSAPVTINDVAFYGLDFVPPSQRDGLDYTFEPANTPHTALVSHGMFEPFAHANWDTDRILAESTVEFDALLLGDNHTPGTKQLDGTWLTYPGSTERTSASEREQRGYNLVTFDDETSIARRTLTTAREFVFVDVELAAGEGTERVLDEVRAHDHENAVTIITVEGDGEQVTPGPVEELAKDAGALVARVNDRRDLPEETADHDVQFADPDAAVRERIRSMGLSTAAHDLDDAIRDDGVADTNVRETVERRLREHLSEGLSAFEQHEGDDPSSDTDSSSAGGGEAGEPAANKRETGVTDDASGTATDDNTSQPAKTDEMETATENGSGQRSVDEFLEGS